MTKPWVRLIVAFFLVAFSASCTHNPITDKPIAQSFEGCMALNTGLGIGVGLFAGALTKSLVGKMTDNKNTAKTASRVVGAAAFLGTVLMAWKKCGEAHQTVTNTEEKTRDQIQRAGTGGPALVVDQLALTVGPVGQDITSVARYTVLASDPAKTDIPVKEVRTVRVPKVVKDEQDRIYFADQQNKLLLDKAGRPIPVDCKTPYDRNALAFEDLAFPVDSVVKQGMRKADGLLPTPKDMPECAPYRFRFAVEAEGMRAEKEVDFTFAKAGQAAATFTAKDAPAVALANAPSAPAQNVVDAPASTPLAQADESWSGAVKQASLLRDKPGGKRLASVPKGTLIVLLEDPSAGAKDTKSSDWVKVRLETGATGWLRKSEIKGLK